MNKKHNGNLSTASDLRKKNLKLFLHIGCNKCGSTSLQNQLISNSQYNKNIFSLVESWGEEIGSARDLSIAFSFKPLYWKEIRNMTDAKIRAVKDSLHSKTRKEIEKKRQLGITNFIASSEHIFNSLLSHEEISNMANFLYEYFDEIIIIFYYRSQTELIPSVWAQKINGNERSSISFSDYLDKIKSYTPTNMAPHSNLTSFKTNFNGLVVNTIDKENLQGGNIFEDFSSITGFKFQNIDKIEYENVTAGHVSLNLHRAINKIFKFIPSSLFFLPKSIINLVSTFLSQDKIKHLNERELPDKCLLDNKKTNEDFLKGRSVMLPTKKY